MKSFILIYAALLSIFLIVGNSSAEAQQRRSERNRERGSEKHRNRYQRHHNDISPSVKKRRIDHRDDHTYYVRSVKKHHHVNNSVHRNKSYCHSHRPEYVYLQRLPSHRYLSFTIGYNTYYHCQGYFYTYRPGRGYCQVELELPMVEYMPHHCRHRIVDGNSYYYKDGYYYIPQNQGFLRVRENRPTQTVCRTRN